MVISCVSAMHNLNDCTSGIRLFIWKRINMNKLSRRRFLQYGGGFAAATMVTQVETSVFATEPTGTVRDRLWIWGHLEGSYDDSYGLPQNSRVTPLQGAEYLSIPNLIMVRYDGKPAPPFDDYAKQYSSMKKLMWSFVGAGGGTSREEQEIVVELAKKMPNITGLFMDDFFHGNAVPVKNCWLAENNPEFPVTVSLQFPASLIANEIELLQSDWKTGDYRTSDIAVDVLAEGRWNEAVKGKLANQGGVVTVLNLPEKPINGLRIRFLGTHDVAGARSVGLGSLRLLNDGRAMSLSGVKVEASSSYPGHEPEALLASLSPDAMEPPASCSLEDLREIRKKLDIPGRKLDLGVTLYTHQLNPAICRHLGMCDVVSFWSWTADELVKLKENFAKYRQLAPKKRTLLGIYMWDFGMGKPLPMDLMRMQCETALKWLREGEIEGMIFLASNICDMKLEAVEWAKKWIAEHGNETL